MTRLNEDALWTLRAVGMPVSEWARRWGNADGRWRGDVCGCPDDRCVGYHHDAGQRCGCLSTLLAPCTCPACGRDMVETHCVYVEEDRALVSFCACPACAREVDVPA